jgi:DNA-binding transcriptional regulator YhcF (GntR family)
MIVEIDPDSPTPPYEQLREQIARMIASGTLAPGTRLPSIRQLATDLQLAPGTVARSYRELERDRLVVPHRRHGTVVTAPADRTPQAARDQVTTAARRYATLVAQLGVDASEALGQVQAALERLTEPSG